MNTAIADGFDLGWKLAWVLKGWAPASLLDSYEGERRPIVEHNLARSAEEDGSRRSTLDEVHVDLRGRISHHWVRGAGDRVSTLDLVGPGVTVFAGPRWASGDTNLTGQGPTVTVRRVDELTTRGDGDRHPRVARGPPRRSSGGSYPSNRFAITTRWIWLVPS